MSLEEYADYMVLQDGINTTSTTDPGHGTRLSMTSAASRCCELMGTDDPSLAYECIVF